MNKFLFACFTLCSCLAASASHAQAESQGPSAEQQLLQRIYQMRMRLEQERAIRDNEARANVRLIAGSQGRTDSPTVSGLRRDTNQRLARFENQFRCLDVDLEGATGNTVVICGDNAGDINGTNVSAERDIVTINGGQP